MKRRRWWRRPERPFMLSYSPSLPQLQVILWRIKPPSIRNKVQRIINSWWDLINNSYTHSGSWVSPLFAHSSVLPIMLIIHTFDFILFSVLFLMNIFSYFLTWWKSREYFSFRYKCEWMSKWTHRERERAEQKNVMMKLTGSIKILLLLLWKHTGSGSWIRKREKKCF
jgi:hypothetical protein